MLTHSAVLLKVNKRIFTKEDYRSLKEAFETQKVGVCVCVCVYLINIYVCIYIYTHTHTYIYIKPRVNALPKQYLKADM